MTQEKIKERIINLRYEIISLTQTAIECGNKHPETNFLIRDRMKLLEKYLEMLK